MARKRKNGGTVSQLAHLLALRECDRAFYEERDRRYAEVNIEREKALKIKDIADRDALSLAKQIQDQKDEKANNLRSQIEGERGLYATKTDLAAAVEKVEAIISPLSQFVASQQGRSGGVGMSWQTAVSLVTVALALAAVYLKH